MLTTFNTIVDQSLIASGNLTLEKSSFDLRQHLESVIKIIRPLALASKRFEVIHTTFHPNIDQVFLGDPYRISQLLLYVLENIIKSAGGKALSLSAEMAEENSHRQLIRININGVDRKVLENLASKLSAHANPGGRKKPLDPSPIISICQGLVYFLHAEISVQHDHTNESTLVMLLPLLKGNLKSHPSHPQPTITGKELENRCVLVADGAAINLSIVRNILNEAGANVLKAHNGIEALKVLEETTVDLVLLDHRLPILDGEQTARIIRSKYGDRLPIVAMTTYPITEKDQRFLHSGLDDYLTSPFGPQQLLDKINHWLQLRTLKNEEKPSTQPLFDLNRLDAIAPGNAAFKRRMVDLFKSLSQTSVQEMKAALPHDPEENIQKIAHRLKPSISTLGIDSLKEPLTALESGTLASEEKEKAIQQLETVLSQVYKELDRLEP
ncbi:ATP-binding response regulator [Echinicola vietnamensis]|uniref:Response regulator with CheY-like receiver domain and winged-helix DNA-binding domain n=1 Tax=Echinicola vietnamensis (strain DSM 17526 / LMG 23754 / KMM 6221) TaxID=926556 RepID=L0G625_ECHVK|nr:response regulator [Echinicola vietnamensis]AGA80748.1 response regulator with CheY-like receiver domain and winged-helix DNA-binding domain [Echinicola vietnamensis DSM 17526]